MQPNGQFLLLACADQQSDHEQQTKPKESDDDMVLSFDLFVFQVIYQPFVGVGLVQLRVSVLKCHSCFPIVHTQIASKKNTKEAKGKGGRVHKKDKHYKGQVMGNRE